MIKLFLVVLYCSTEVEFKESTILEASVQKSLVKMQKYENTNHDTSDNINDEPKIHDKVNRNTKERDRRRRSVKTKIDSEINLEDKFDSSLRRNGVHVEPYLYHISYGRKCSGALIHKAWAITAAHCEKAGYIRAGSDYFGFGRLIKIKQYFLHPLWAGKKKQHPYDYDIQLLKLTVTLTITDHIQPIQLGKWNDVRNGSYKIISVTGWINPRTGGHSNLLQAVTIPIIPIRDCITVKLDEFQNLTKSMFCAGFKSGKRSGCQGNIGSPAVLKDRLLGISSFSQGCEPGTFGVYINVPAELKWIRKTIASKSKN